MAGVREVAWQILNKCEAAGQYSNIALDVAIKRGDWESQDRGLLTSLVYGVIEKRIPLDAAIDSLCRREDALPLEVRNLLRMGIYQMAFLDRIPDHAAVNETVSLAPKRFRGFVNAVLRSFLRGGKRIPVPDVTRDPIGYLSVTHSVGEALCRRFVEELGFSRTEAILSAFGRQPDLTVRVNSLRTTREELMREWSARGIAVEAARECSDGVRILDRSPVPSLYGFEEGLFFVQDEASQLCVKALEAKAGMRVLDACACPGSKSFGAAMDMQNEGEVLSCDLHANKLSLVKSGAARLGISIIQTEARDARVAREEWSASFDRVLCDVPCSGFGVLAKKPELRYKDPAESERLPEIQKAILNTAATYVRPGGRLVYSTCTLLSAENERAVEAFLERHTEFSLVSMRTLYPDIDGTDGFFFAVMQRS